MEVALSRLWAPADQTMTYPLNIVTQIESSERKIRLFPLLCTCADGTQLLDTRFCFAVRFKSMNELVIAPFCHRREKTNFKKYCPNRFFILNLVHVECDV